MVDQQRLRLALDSEHHMTFRVRKFHVVVAWVYYMYVFRVTGMIFDQLDANDKFLSFLPEKMCLPRAGQPCAGTWSGALSTVTGH